MGKLSLREINQSQLNETPVADGQLICCLDTGNTYRDTAAGRIQIARDIEIVNELPLAPLDGKVYCTEAGDLYLFWGGEKIRLNQKVDDVLYCTTTDKEDAVYAPVDCDTLGGVPAAEYAKKEDLESHLIRLLTVTVPVSGWVAGSYTVTWDDGSKTTYNQRNRVAADVTVNSRIDVSTRTQSTEAVRLIETIENGAGYLDFYANAVPSVDAVMVIEVNEDLVRPTLNTDDLLRIMTAPNAGAHNAVYRGKALGSEVTDAQWATIAAGSFNDLYIGDYWTKDGVNYRIAAFNYLLHTGDTEFTANHIVIVPDTGLYNAQMHNTSSGGYEDGANTTAGGYVDSDMYKTNLANAKTTIKNAFSGHVLSHRIYLTNAVTNGYSNGGAWYDSEVDLMCEQMVYGSGVFSPVSDGSIIPENYRVEKSQLPLFQHEPSRITYRTAWWLRDVISPRLFAKIGAEGDAENGNTSYAYGVRPYFCIG